MNPTIAIILALLQQLDPKDVAKILAGLVHFLDPIFANKGPLIRWAWSILKLAIPTESFAGEIANQATAVFAANPSLMATITPISDK